MSIEMNAHSLFNSILLHIDRGDFEGFYPYMFSSQPCESLYRIWRSMSTKLSVMINCSTLEALYKVLKIEKQCKIMNKTYENHNIVYPRKSQFRSSFDCFDKKAFPDKAIPDIPTNLPEIGDTFHSKKEKCEVEKAMKKILQIAKRDAYAHIAKFGIKREKTGDEDVANYIHVNIKSNLLADKHSNQDFSDEDDIDDVNSEVNELINQGKLNCNLTIFNATLTVFGRIVFKLC